MQQDQNKRRAAATAPRPSPPASRTDQKSQTNFLKLAILPIVAAIIASLLSQPHTTNLTSTDAQSSRIRTVYQFSDTSTWIENIAVRSNGNLLVTLVRPAPDLWEIDPATSRATLVHRFDGMPLLTGITELEPDVFAVGSPQTLWRVDFNRDSAVSEIVTIPEAGSLNGMATLDAARGTILVADHLRGAVWKVDVRTGERDVVLQDETMAPDDGVGPLVGIDGLRLLGDVVYYNNCPRRLYCRVRIDRETGAAVGPYEVVAEDVMADDFALGPDAVGYLAGLVDNVVTRVFPNGTYEVVAGAVDETVFAGATSAAFGRAPGDEKVLYVTTGGVWGIPVTDTDFEGGKVVAVRI